MLPVKADEEMFETCICMNPGRASGNLSPPAHVAPAGQSSHRPSCAEMRYSPAEQVTAYLNKRW